MSSNNSNIPMENDCQASVTRPYDGKMNECLVYGKLGYPNDSYNPNSIRNSHPNSNPA
jgi:hypothetical protein